jgi:hypothetical protein
MRAACLRIGGLLNQTELGRDVSISQPQVHRFMNLMETSFQAIRLAAYSVNRTKRLIKAPKLSGVTPRWRSTWLEKPSREERISMRHHALHGHAAGHRELQMAQVDIGEARRIEQGAEQRVHADDCGEARLLETPRGTPACHVGWPPCCRG